MSWCGDFPSSTHRNNWAAGMGGEDKETIIRLRDVGTDNIATENSKAVGTDDMETEFVETDPYSNAVCTDTIVSDSMETDPISKAVGTIGMTTEGIVTVAMTGEVGTDNIATDPMYSVYSKTEKRNAEREQLKTYVKHVTMASASATKPPLTTHILDTARGIPAATVPMILSYQGQNGMFSEMERGVTNSDGRGSFLSGKPWTPGVYKLHFDTDAYLKPQGITGFYPFVEVVFRIVDPAQHYHVPLLLSPFSYSTYRGS